MAPQSEPISQASPNRPKMPRIHRSDPSPHPVLVKRSELCHTHGAVYLPGSDSPPHPELPITLQQPHRRPSLLRRYASEIGGLERGEILSSPRRWTRFQVEGTDPVTRSDNPQVMASKGSPQSDATDIIDEPLNCPPESDLGLQLGPDSSRPSSLRRPSSFDEAANTSTRKPLVRFASTDAFQDDDFSLPGDSTERITCPRPGHSTFTNPFGSGSEKTSRSNSSSSDAASYLRIGAFAGHRDTFARIHFDKRVTPYVPSHVIENILRHLPAADYLNLRLTCRQWCRALPQPSMSAVHRLPREILQLIFSFQDPCDFEAARHGCREWFVAGLDLSLLCGMLRSMQCQHA